MQPPIPRERYRYSAVLTKEKLGSFFWSVVGEEVEEELGFFFGLWLVKKWKRSLVFFFGLWLVEGILSNQEQAFIGGM